MFALLFTGGLVATFWWPVEARLIGFEVGVGGYNRHIASGYYDWGSGRALILNFGAGTYRVAWSRSPAPTAPEIKFVAP